MFCLVSLPFCFSSCLFLFFSNICFSNRFILGLSSHKVKLKTDDFCFLLPSPYDWIGMGVALADTDHPSNLPKNYTLSWLQMVFCSHQDKHMILNWYCIFWIRENESHSQLSWSKYTTHWTHNIYNIFENNDKFLNGVRISLVI